jgi:hypothetical protein
MLHSYQWVPLVCYLIDSDGIDNQTPNFAMDTSDVDSTRPAREKKYTAHLFDPSKPSFFGDRALPSGTPLQVSANTSDWPPAILFDAVYASTVLHHFGAQTLKDKLAATWQDTYPNGIMNQAQVDHQAITNAQAATKERAQTQEEAHRACQEAHYEAHHEAHHEACTCPDTFDMLLALPYILVPRNELQAVLREAKEKAAVTEQRHVQEKVDTWNRQVIAS